MNKRREAIEWLVANAPSARDDAYIGEIAEEVYGENNERNRSAASSAINAYRRVYPDEIKRGHASGWFYSEVQPDWSYPSPSRTASTGSRVYDQTSESKAKRARARMKRRSA